MGKINKRYSADIKGILNLEDSIVAIEIEDLDEPIILSEFIKDFNGKEVKITIAHGEEL